MERIGSTARHFPTEREVTRVAATPSATTTPGPSMPTTKPKPAKPAIDKGKVYVEVYNNSGVSGLAGRVATTATQAGWKVVGSDNWYGTIPASSVYYPPSAYTPDLTGARSRARRRIVLDPEDGRVGARRNERRIGRRPTGARGLARVVSALDEHGTVRKARPVRLRGAV